MYLILFLIGCIGTRLAVTLLASQLPTRYLPYMGVIALVIAIGFATIYINGWRKTGREVGGERIWWNALRPVHAGLWFVFAILALAQNHLAWVVLFIDTLLGLTTFTYAHFF